MLIYIVTVYKPALLGMMTGTIGYMYISKSAFRLVAIAVLFMGFAGYNFIRAYDESIWFPPDPGTPPANNVASPLNTGSTNQIKNGGLAVNALLSSGEIVSYIGSGAGQVRMVGGSYGAFLRNDGINTYFLLTKPDDTLGTWNGLRPFYVANKTGMVNMNQGLTVNSGAINAKSQVNAKKYCDTDGNHCLDLSACKVGDTLMLQSSGEWGCSSKAVIDYASYIKSNCGLTVPNPGSFSINAVLQKNGNAYDLYDGNGAYSLLAWECIGPDLATNNAIEASCGFSVINPGTVSLNSVLLKNGSYYDFYDGNGATANLKWSCQ